MSGEKKDTIKATFDRNNESVSFGHENKDDEGTRILITRAQDFVLQIQFQAEAFFSIICDLYC